MKRQNLRTVSLIVGTFTYLLIGAAIFGYLESEHENRSKEILLGLESSIKRKYDISDEDYSSLTTIILKSAPHKAGTQWKFPGAFYFATTVVTTIGYGHSTPSTMGGRCFCMFYALIGIPLGLVMFQSIGERLNTFVRLVLRHAKRCFKAKNPEVTQTNLVTVVLMLSTLLMTGMATIFSKAERWDYFDALYYCFITLTTIGFGDYVALQKDYALQENPKYVVLSLVFILFGLSVVSSAVNLLVLKFLTLNTEDERRDEQLRYTANLNPILLEGDVITPASRQQPASAAAVAAVKRQAIVDNNGDRQFTDDDNISSSASKRQFARKHRKRHQTASIKRINSDTDANRYEDNDDDDVDVDEKQDSDDREHHCQYHSLALVDELASQCSNSDCDPSNRQPFDQHNHHPPRRRHNHNHEHDHHHFRSQEQSPSLMQSYLCQVDNHGGWCDHRSMCDTTVDTYDCRRSYGCGHADEDEDEDEDEDDGGEDEDEEEDGDEYHGFVEHHDETRCPKLLFETVPVYSEPPMPSQQVIEYTQPAAADAGGQLKCGASHLSPLANHSRRHLDRRQESSLLSSSSSATLIQPAAKSRAHRRQQQPQQPPRRYLEQLTAGRTTGQHLAAPLSWRHEEAARSGQGSKLTSSDHQMGMTSATTRRKKTSAESAETNSWLSIASFGLASSAATAATSLSSSAAACVVVEGNGGGQQEKRQPRASRRRRRRVSSSCYAAPTSNLASDCLVSANHSQSQNHSSSGANYNYTTTTTNNNNNNCSSLLSHQQGGGGGGKSSARTKPLIEAAAAAASTALTDNIGHEQVSSPECSPAQSQSGQRRRRRRPTIQRLDCKCCCKHLECIQHALADSSRQTIAAGQQIEQDKMELEEDFNHYPHRRDSSSRHRAPFGRERRPLAVNSNSTGNLVATAAYSTSIVEQQPAARGRPSSKSSSTRTMQQQADGEDDGGGHKAEIFSIQTSSLGGHFYGGPSAGNTSAISQVEDEARRRRNN